MKVFQSSRRSFLMTSGAALAMPMLESYAKETKLSKAPTRMIFCGVGYGFEEDTFYPKKVWFLI